MHYLNTNTQLILFRDVLNSEIYVDKSMLIRKISPINDENALSCVITLCYLYARKDYRIEREAKSGKGYCDFLFLPKREGKAAIILELKVDDSPQNAIDQIKQRNYVQQVETCGEVLFVGISYDRKAKKHSCLIEKHICAHFT